MKVIARADARAAGLETYFTGKPCSRGMIAERNVRTKRCLCTACHAAERDRARRIHCENREKILEYQRQYYKSNRDSEKERSRRWRLENIESVNARRAIYRSYNREAIAASQRLYVSNNRERVLESNRAWRQENRASVIEQKRNYYAKNKALAYAMSAKRRAVKKTRIPLWYGEYDEFVMREAADLAMLREDATGIKWHVDHMIPLLCHEASGFHCGSNIQVIPAYLNQKKHNKLMLHEPGQWLLQL